MRRLARPATAATLSRRRDRTQGNAARCERPNDIYVDHRDLIVDSRHTSRAMHARAAIRIRLAPAATGQTARGLREKASAYAQLHNSGKAICRLHGVQRTAIKMS